jgi:hypothetical protein
MVPVISLFDNYVTFKRAPNDHANEGVCVLALVVCAMLYASNFIIGSMECSGRPGPGALPGAG